MSAYIIVDVHVLNPEGYEEYKKLTPGTLKPFGGEFIVRGGESEVIEGKWQPGRLVILRFPSMEKARAWWNSAEYTKARAIRLAHSKGNMVLVEGN